MNKVSVVVALLASLGSASCYLILEEAPMGFPPALPPGYTAYPPAYPAAYPPGYPAYAVPAPVQEIVAAPAPQPTLVSQSYPVGYQGYSYGTNLQPTGYNPTGYNYNYVYGGAAPAVAEPAAFGLGGFPYPYAYTNDWFYRNN
ncbi:uncharacterized protein LOC105395001 [Plutella xylostella]|uniref:uncharacterized protein LOC105395001 n=1 Tax=Plutella xylostella TaxID=51655 RepID=UPI002032D5C9|nr:uncharacterized protein LOC105395001 [Plutella xylostella]